MDFIASGLPMVGQLREKWWNQRGLSPRIKAHQIKGVKLDPGMYRLAKDGSARLLPRIQAEKALRQTRHLRRAVRKARRERKGRS
jgi:hypothetical protein